MQSWTACWMTSGRTAPPKQHLQPLSQLCMAISKPEIRRQLQLMRQRNKLLSHLGHLAVQMQLSNVGSSQQQCPIMPQQLCWSPRTGLSTGRLTMLSRTHSNSDSGHHPAQRLLRTSLTQVWGLSRGSLQKPSCVQMLPGINARHQRGGCIFSTTAAGWPCILLLYCCGASSEMALAGLHFMHIHNMLPWLMRLGPRPGMHTGCMPDSDVP